MENASKALLIAGAVLIVILIIGVGMMIYNGAHGSIDTAITQMSAQEKQIFNAQFTSYDGKMSGTKVKSLIGAVITNNAENKANTTQKVVNVVTKGVTDFKDANVNDSAKLSTLNSKINTNKSYTVTLTYDDTTALVKTITIEQDKNQ